MEVLIMAALVLVNGCYIAYLHRHLRRLEERHQALAAADRRLVVTAREVGGELRAVIADLKKHEAAAVDEFAKLFHLALKIVNREYGTRTVRNSGQTAVKPGNGRVRCEQPGPYEIN